MADPGVLEIAGVTKAYSGLRPLRIRALRIAAGERVAIAGLDAAAAELLVNLVTGAALPDAGTIRVLGHSTAEITDGDAWLATLDRFGIVTERAVMLEGATLAQNLAMPFTLEIEPVPPDVQARVRALAVECGVSGDSAAWLDRPAGEAPPEIRLRGHVARAIALEPALVLLEHPTATIPEAGRAALADDLVRVLEARRLAALVMTQDRPFAARVAHRALTLDGATGELAPSRSRRWWW
jgi:predicted ABC-type transport system involved in lysophospholipase L1 biosynthesis ATPase subunit